MAPLETPVQHSKSPAPPKSTFNTSNKSPMLPKRSIMSSIKSPNSLKRSPISAKNPEKRSYLMKMPAMLSGRNSKDSSKPPQDSIEDIKFTRFSPAIQKRPLPASEALEKHRKLLNPVTMDIKNSTSGVFATNSSIRSKAQIKS